MLAPVRSKRNGQDGEDWNYHKRGRDDGQPRIDLSIVAYTKFNETDADDE